MPARGSLLRRQHYIATLAAVACIALLLHSDVRAAPSPGEGISVREAGALGDGVADDTRAFELAIARAKERGEAVVVPKGRYRITRTLTLRSQSLIGNLAGAWVADEVPLPTILPETKDGPCIRLLAGASVHGLHFFHDWHGKSPAPRPPTIQLAGVGCRVSDVKIHGAWDAIAADGESNVGRSLIQNCFIVDVHHVGVRMTGTWDVSWISKVEVWSPASKTFPDSGVGFQLGKNDVLLVSDCFVFKAKVGYHLLDEIPGCEIKGRTWGSFSNCAADFCGVGVGIKGSHTVSFAGGTFWTHFGGMIIRGDGAQVRLSGVELAANGGPALTVEDCELVAVSGCQLRRKHKDFDVPALRITGGKGTTVTGCVIVSSSKGVEVKEGLKDVVLASNIVQENVKEKEERPAE